MEPGHSFVMASRCLENTPDNDVNLARFLQDRAEIGGVLSWRRSVIQGAKKMSQNGSTE